MIAFGLSLMLRALRAATVGALTVNLNGGGAAVQLNGAGGSLGLNT